MRFSRHVVAVGFTIAVCGAPVDALADQAGAPAPAQASAAPDVKGVQEELARLRAEFDQLRRQYDERLLSLERRLTELGGGPLVVPAPSPSDPVGPPASREPAPARAPQAQGIAATSKIFNPDISVNGNVVGAAGRNPVNGLPPLDLSEVEAAFQAVVDPYARADFYFAASPEGVEVEEAFVTFTALPANLLFKAGKMRAQFGKVNTLHTHALPTIDRPLVTDNLLGGEEGLSDAGLSLSYLVRNPHLFLELTGEVYQGASEVFQSSARSDLTWVGRVRGYRDLTEATNLDFGASMAFGPTDVGAEESGLFELDPSAPSLTAPVLDKQLFGVDLTFRYRPLRRAIYRRLNLRTELIWSRQDLPGQERSNAFGFYALGEYQFARRWYAGARLDRSGRALEAGATDSGASLFLTFWPSEFSQLRGQFRRINFAEGLKANELLFQFNFSIGAHGAHVF